LCNAMLFHALHWARDEPTRVGFVHIPQIGETGLLTPAQALTGARLIVETAIGAPSTAPTIA